MHSSALIDGGLETTLAAVDPSRRGSASDWRGIVTGTRAGSRMTVEGMTLGLRAFKSDYTGTVTIALTRFSSLVLLRLLNSCSPIEVGGSGCGAPGRCPSARLRG